jgi:hypothetical protein
VLVGVGGLVQPSGGCGLLGLGKLDLEVGKETLSGLAVLAGSFLGKGLEVIDLVETLDLDLGDFDDQDELGNSGVDGGEFDSLEGVESGGSSLDGSEDVGLEGDSDLVFRALLSGLSVLSGLSGLSGLSRFSILSVLHFL